MLKPEKEYVKKLIEENLRIGGRNFLEMRKLCVETGLYQKAEGSALVKLGETMVAVGIKMSVEEPFPDTPDEGILIVNAEFPPVASPEFEPGPPGDEAIELARVIDRGIRESRAIDFEKLCIVPGEKVWSVFIDIHVLNDDGNLIDASGIGAILALLNTKIPKYDQENDEVIYTEKTEPLPITKVPIPFTFAKIGNKILLDPCKEEEEAMDARFTVTIAEGKICAMQKGHGGFFTTEEVKNIIKTAMEKYKKVREILNI
ncbi:MAG TPA: exosome complex protein Rrp42 [Nanoarchaeota archaeon]|nr:exosome complex protein Rrp42 [Nanoarchaeota archaeon]